MNKLYPLTYPQKSIWYMGKIYAETSMANVSGTLRFHSTVDFKILEEAINIFIKINEGMRLRIIETETDVYQYVSDFSKSSIKFIDFSNKPIEELYYWEMEQTKVAIDIIDKPLFEFIMLKINDNDGGFYIKTSHMISDAWSMMLIGSQITKIYTDLFYIRKIAIESPSYIEYISKENEYISSERFNIDNEYWNQKLKNFEELTVLKENKLEWNNTKASRKVFLVPKKLSAKISQFCQDNNVSEYALFVSAVSMYINRVTGKKDLIFGTSLLNRSNFKEKNTIGMFASTAIPLKIEMPEDINFETFVKEISKEIMAVLRHQGYPYENMLREVKKRDKNINKLFDIVLNYQNAKKARKEDEIDYTTRWHFNSRQIESLIINVNDRDGDGHLIIDYDFLEELFNVKEIEFLHQHVINILWHALDNTKKSINRLEMLSEPEKKQILEDFNNTDAVFDRSITIHEIFEEVVRKYPYNIAAKFNDDEITYKELNEKANRLARTLRRLGINREEIIPVIANKSIDIIIATLAILKAGGAYLPIDPEFPNDRKLFMIKDTNAKILLTQSDLDGQIVFNGETILIDKQTSYDNNADNLDNINNQEDLLYIIYTSGSTGNPKGVMIENRNVVRLLFNSKFQFDFTEKDVWTMFHSYCFDFSVWEMYGALLYGGKLVIIDKETARDLGKFIKILKKEKVTVLNQTPAMFYNLIDEELRVEKRDLMLRCVIFGGEALKPNMLKRFKEKYPSTKLINMYGITETTVHVTFKELSDKDIESSKSNIGKPIPTLKTYIMDKNLNLLPINIPGEICVAGAGVARGYLNRPELTAEKFVINPYNNNERIYRSGDLGRYYAKGDIEYLGRIDTQVKVRGFRVEIGEIERHILKFTGVKDVVVIANKDEQEKSYLCAYLVCDKKIVLKKLKEHLLKLMPSYMVPSYFVIMDKLPLTVNGKIDRKELPEPVCYATNEDIYVEHRNETDKILQDVWKEALKVKKIGIDSNFFDLGGDSLTVIQVLTRLYKYKFRITATDFYKYPTIREISDKISNVKAECNGYDELKYEKVPYNKPIVKITNVEQNFNNVFLTGATGFLGSHILKELLYTTNAKVYCLVRGYTQQKAEKRLIDILKFYFTDEICSYINDRIIVVNGDVTSENLGMPIEIYNELGTHIHNIIHTAALVKYYGEYSDFENININGTKNVINFAKAFSIKMNHISTIGVSGSYLVKSNIGDVKLTENDLYVGQNYSENAYVQSKFEAENMIIKEINDGGLNATIFRMGNLTGRFSDGYFQRNIKDNAFYNILKSVIELKKVSEKMLDVDVELTPVDLAANAIISIIGTRESANRVFHITNYKELKFSEINKILEKLGFKIDIVSNEEFKEYVKQIAENEDRRYMLNGIIADMSQTGELDYNIPVKVEVTITKNYLELLNFRWPDIDIEYIEKIIHYLRTIKFLIRE